MAKDNKTSSFKPEPKPVIVEAVGVASSSKNANLSKELEKAMSDAIMKALSAGITDPDEQRALMLKARDDTKAKFLDAEATDT